MTQINAKIVADSINPQGDRITTMMVTFPRYILAELNTHRMFSRNSASSRAIPFKKMVESVKNNPFIPIAWQKDHSGMQGTEYFTESKWFETEWKIAAEQACYKAEMFSESNLTKQLVNRLLEPFMWHTVLITATEWENFFQLRCPQYSNFFIGEGDRVYRSKKDLCKDASDPKIEEAVNVSDFTQVEWLLRNKGQADIHMMALAEAMWDARNESTPKQLQAGEWHIPFGDSFLDQYGETLDYSELNEPSRIKIATARCARVSYTVVGEEDKPADYKKDLELHDRLLQSGHFSPFEHCAKAMSWDEREVYIKGKMEWNHGSHNTLISNQQNEGWCLNYRGFIQYRALIN